MLDKQTPQPALDAPIPGQGMTAPLGGRPWQQPPRFSIPEKALSFYMEKITEPKQANKMFDLMELGVPVDALVDVLQLNGVMEGVHSVDVGVIITPALAEAMSLMADKAGVEYQLVSTDPDEGKVSGTQVALSLNELDEGEGGIDFSMDEKKPEEEAAVIEEVVSEEPKGLMARRI